MFHTLQTRGLGAVNVPGNKNRFEVTYKINVAWDFDSVEVVRRSEGNQNSGQDRISHTEFCKEEVTNSILLNY
jgi:hypothetical protein